MPLEELSDDLKLDEAVGICISLATTLAAMHARGHSHRDLKPGNILRLNDDWCLGDFGLADFPDKAAVTKEGEKLGPQNYMAPEMLLNAGGDAAD
jgi:serine/threonine protein kinase